MDIDLLFKAYKFTCEQAQLCGVQIQHHAWFTWRKIGVSNLYGTTCNLSDASDILGIGTVTDDRSERIRIVVELFAFLQDYQPLKKDKDV